MRCHLIIINGAEQHGGRIYYYSKSGWYDVFIAVLSLSHSRLEYPIEHLWYEVTVK